MGHPPTHKKLTESESFRIVHQKKNQVDSERSTPELSFRKVSEVKVDSIKEHREIHHVQVEHYQGHFK